VALFHTLLPLAQHVLVKYKTLLMKMAIDGQTNDKANENFDLLCDVKILFKFLAIFSLLQLVHNLIKFNQLWDVFIYDFVATTKVRQGEIYELYIDLNMPKYVNAFKAYKALLCAKHDHSHVLELG
jgi:hypothetical protein